MQLQAHLKGKAGSPARRGIYRHIAAHAAGNGARDIQSKPRAGSRQRIAPPLKTFKDALGVFKGQTRPCILHQNPETQGVRRAKRSACRFSPGGPHADAHTPKFGKLHRVAHKVAQGLTQTKAVAHNGVRQLRVHVQIDIQPLGLCHRQEQDDAVVKGRTQGKGGGPQLQRALLKTCVIGNVAHHFQQSAARLREIAQGVLAFLFRRALLL